MRQWPYTNPYYNPMTMRASVLEELNDCLIYSGYQLGFIQLKDRKLTSDLNLQLHDDQSRANFASTIGRQEPDVTVFFMEHIFSHRHTQDGKKGDMRFRISLDKPTWMWLLEEMKTGLLLWILRMVATAGGYFSLTRIGTCPCVEFRIGRNGAGYNPWSGRDDVLKGIGGPQHRLQTGT